MTSKFVALMIPAFAVILAAAPAAGQEAPRPTCASISDAGLPPSLSAWTKRSPLVAGAWVSDPDMGVAQIGRAFAVALQPNGEVRFPAAPSKPGAPDSHGGLLAFQVEEGGDYQVALGAGAWIDVVGPDGLALSSGHAHGPACTTLRKSVTFPLKPGRYLLEITGNGETVLPVMISRVPSAVQGGGERR